MEGFSINYALIRVRLKKVSEGINMTVNKLEELSEYIKNLDIFWDGDASEAYKIRVYCDIEALMETVREFAKLMELCDEALIMYQDNEKVIKQLIGGFMYDWKEKRGN